MTSFMTSPAPSRPRILWVDIIRSVSAFGVIFTHVTMVIVNYWGKRPIQTGDEGWWTTGVFYAYLARSALGLFFMLSGYLLLSSQGETFTFLKKSLWKLLLPLAFWGTFYLIWNGNLPEDPIKLVKYILLSLATGKVEFHLWFLYAFIGLYLFVPILRIFLRTAQDRDVWYYVAVWFLLVPVSSLIFQLTGDVIALMNYASFSGFIGYFLLGYLLGRLKLDSKWILAAWILIPLWVAAETYFQYSQTRALKAMQDQWFDTLTVMVIPYTLIMFVALKGLGEHVQSRLSPTSRVPGFWEAQSRASYGIILIHVVVLQVMYAGINGFHLAPFDFHPALAVPVVSIVGYIVCFGIVYVVQKIPILRSIVPA
jgi:surface polysaccharide O-acyltransferase-like enzyme